MKKKIGKILLEYLLIALGTFLLALGINMFLLPFKISSGGVSSIATVLYYLFGIPLSVTTILFNAVLFIFSFKFLEKSSIIKTVAGIVFLSGFLEVTSLFPVYTEDLFIATVIGGVLIGAGVGLVIRQEASTGGSDFAALMLSRIFPHISVAVLIMIIDCAIVIFSGLVFKSITIMFYSAIALFIATKVSDAIIVMGDVAKSVYIFSSKNDEISSAIMEKFSRGVTGIYSKGMYSEADSTMLLSVVSPKELPFLIHLVRSIDKNAFIIVYDAKEVLGEGFKQETSYDLLTAKKDKKKKEKKVREKKVKEKKVKAKKIKKKSIEE